MANTRKSLASFLTSIEPPPLAPILPIFGRLVATLHSIHAASPSAAHQPLTPDTILLSDHDHPLIQTFPTRTANPNASSETVVFSKPKYSAPDAFLNTAATTSSSSCSAIDTYILGFIFYEILCGQRLFRSQFAALDDGPPTLWLKWHLDPAAKPRPLQALRPDLGRLAPVIDAMLEKDPAKRTQTLSSVATLFSDIDERTDQPAIPQPAPPPAKLPQPSPQPPAGTPAPPQSTATKTNIFLNPWLITGAIVGLAIAVLYTLFTAVTSSSVPAPPHG